MDVHARIHSFLQQKTIASLVTGTLELGDDRYLKAGIIPYIHGEKPLYYLMKPVARLDGLPPPDYQICKGTRMYRHKEKGWRDMKEKDGEQDAQETLAETAIREGIEEIGLKLTAIRRLLDVGPYRFSSENTGKRKKMWLYVAEMTSPDDVLPMSQVDKSTAERKWLTLEQFSIVGRADHRYILSDIAAKLRMHFRSERY